MRRVSRFGHFVAFLRDALGLIHIRKKILKPLEGTWGNILETSCVSPNAQFEWTYKSTKYTVRGNMVFSDHNMSFSSFPIISRNSFRCCSRIAVQGCCVKGRLHGLQQRCRSCRLQISKGSMLRRKRIFRSVRLRENS